MADLKIPDLLPLSEIDRFSNLETTISEAEKQRLLADLPAASDEFETNELIDARVRTIRTRLHLLGYLEEDNGLGRADEGLQGAIREFQTEAQVTDESMEIDGWVGSQTWTALCELIGFEDETNVERWMNDNRMGPALTRAVKLRFAALGCLSEGDGKGATAVFRGFPRFARAATVLGLAEEHLTPSVSPRLLSLLFDQNGMVEHLGRRPGGVEIRFGVNTKELDIRIARNFMISLAKVELWLLGYDVRPHGVLLDGPDRTFVEGDELYESLVQFWMDRGRTLSASRDLAKTVDGSFFAQLAAAQDEGEESLRALSGETIYQEIVKQETGIQDKVWQFIKSIGSRIWDGIKRVFRWLGSLFRKGLKAVGRMARNLARLAYSLASESFRIVKEVAKALYESIEFLVQLRFVDSDNGQVVIRHDRDFDYQVYVSPDGQLLRIREIVRAFARRTRMFVLGIRIFGLLTGALVKLLTTAMPVVGTFAFILSCTRIVDDVREVAASARLYRLLAETA